MFLKKTLESSHFEGQEFQNKIFMLLEKVGGVEAVIEEIRNANVKF